MSVIFIILPLALLVVAAAVWAFVWASRRGQFDDLDTPAVRMLHDDPNYKRREQGTGKREGGELKGREKGRGVGNGS